MRISKGGRVFLRLEMICTTQREGNDILKKYNQPVFLQLKDIINISF